MKACNKIKKPIVSIIMPLYNAEKYLRESLDSVLTQKYTDFELICINDCSTDNTGNIINEYSLRDNRIFQINNARRMGAGASRNTGLEFAHGEFLFFLDGDDVFDENLLFKCVRKAEKHDAEIVFFEARHVLSKDIKNRIKAKRTEDFKSKYCEKTFCAEKCELIDLGWFKSAPWTRMIRKSFIDRESIYYQSLESANDLHFAIMTFILSKRMIVLESEEVLVYVRDHNTTSRISNYRDPFCVYHALLEIKESLIQRGIFYDEFKNYSYFVYKMLESAYSRSNDRGIRDLFMEYVQTSGIKELLFPINDYSDEIGRLARSIRNYYFRENKPMSLFYYNILINIERISGYINKQIDIGNRIIIWGVGKNGRAVVDIFTEYKIHIDYLIDRDNNKIGLSYNGYTIKNPEQVKDVGGIFIVTSSVITEEEFLRIAGNERRIVCFSEIKKIC